MKLLLDTHIWLWSHVAPEKLGRRVATALLGSGTELWLSPISIWEFLLLTEKRRIVVAGDPRRWVEEALARVPMREAALNREVALQSRAVRVPQQDPADRFLAATAQVYDLALVTDDHGLLKGKGYRTFPNR